MAKKDKPKVRIRLMAYDVEVIDSCTNSIIDAAKRTGALLHQFFLPRQ